MDSPDTGNPDIRKCKISRKCAESDSEVLVRRKDILVRRKAGSYLMAAKGLLEHANKQLNKVDSLCSINLK